MLHCWEISILRLSAQLHTHTNIRPSLTLVDGSAPAAILRRRLDAPRL